MRWVRALAAPFVLIMAAGSVPGFALYMLADHFGWRGETAAFVSGLSGGVMATLAIGTMHAQHREQ